MGKGESSDRRSFLMDMCRPDNAVRQLLGARDNSRILEGSDADDPSVQAARGECADIKKRALLVLGVDLALVIAAVAGGALHAIDPWAPTVSSLGTLGLKFDPEKDDPSQKISKPIADINRAAEATFKEIIEASKRIQGNSPSEYLTRTGTRDRGTFDLWNSTFVLLAYIGDQSGKLGEIVDFATKHGLSEANYKNPSRKHDKLNFMVAGADSFAITAPEYYAPTNTFFIPTTVVIPNFWAAVLMFKAVQEARIYRTMAPKKLNPKAVYLSSQRSTFELANFASRGRLSKSLDKAWKYLLEKVPQSEAEFAATFDQMLMAVNNSFVGDETYNEHSGYMQFVIDIVELQKKVALARFAHFAFFKLAGGDPPVSSPEGRILAYVGGYIRKTSEELKKAGAAADDMPKKKGLF